jgi:hypothetical protein
VIGYLSLLEFFLWGSRKGTKPQRGLDLCAFPSLREERRKSRETRSKNQEKKEPLDFFAPSRLCEQKTKIKSEN